MTLRLPILIVGACLAVLSLAMTEIPSTKADTGSEQSSARDNVRSGGALKIGQIEALVLPKMNGLNYVGFTYYPAENIYRLRFLDGIRAIDVDVDARTGKILSRSR